MSGGADDAIQRFLALPDGEIFRRAEAMPEDLRREALVLWAEDRAGLHMAAKDPNVRAVQAGAQGVVEGTFLGAFGPKLRAGRDALAHALTGGAYGAPYEPALAYQRAVSREYEGQAPVPYTAGHLGGLLAMLGGLGMGSAAGRAALAGPIGLVPAGATRLGNAARYGAGGAVTAAAAAGGRSDSLGDWLGNAAADAPMGALFGSVFGTIAPRRGANELARTTRELLEGLKRGK